MKTKTLIKVLEKSIEKNGADKALTIGHLLGIIKLANSIDEKIEMDDFKFMEQVDQEYFESTL